MTLKIRFVTLLITLFSLSSVGFAITILYTDISSNIRKSDLVVTGKVVKRTTVFNQRADLGDLYTVAIDKVLYVTPKIASDIFRASDLEQINSRLKRRTSKRILVFLEGGLSLDSPIYFLEDEPILFFFRISDLLRTYPDSYVSHSWLPVNRKIAKIDKLFFEATTGTGDSTLILKKDRRKQKAKRLLPIVEALGGALSLPNEARVVSRLRELTTHKNPLLVGYAQNLLDDLIREKNSATSPSKRVGNDANR